MSDSESFDDMPKFGGDSEDYARSMVLAGLSQFKIQVVRMRSVPPDDRLNFYRPIDLYEDVNEDVIVPFVCLEMPPLEPLEPLEPEIRDMHMQHSEEFQRLTTGEH